MSKKTTKAYEVRTKVSLPVRPIIAFILSFGCIVGVVLSIHRYGTRLTQQVRQLTPHLSLSAPTAVHTTYYDPLDIPAELASKTHSVIFLDVRSADEYKKEHVKGAVSLPLYTIINGAVTYRDVASLTVPPSVDRSKLVVVYGPSTSFQRQQDIVALLKQKGYTTQLLAVGWNELRHFQNIWIPEGLWGKIDVNNIFTTNDTN